MLLNANYCSNGVFGTESEIVISWCGAVFSDTISDELKGIYSFCKWTPF